MSWLPLRIETLRVSESLNIPVTAVGSKPRRVLPGVPGVEVPDVEVDALHGAVPESTARRWAASEPLTSVTERSQSDLPVEMTTLIGKRVESAEQEWNEQSYQINR